MDDLLADLVAAERAAQGSTPCTLCEYINTQTGVTRDALIAAAAGSIGERKLVSVLKKHETGIGRRTISRHREEEHKP